ncbi:MAG: LysM peptidoglycan-binding domain-containing protein [Ktedonobacterales bacterium]|nr:LysM peptidoglycan-binding domain-containing protein [Ktedonobacterales bacterium]
MKRFVILAVLFASTALAALATSPALAKANLRAGCVYAVQPGDTLSGIATRFSASWPALYALNQETVGGDPNLIYPGQQIALCGTASVAAEKAVVASISKPKPKAATPHKVTPTKPYVAPPAQSGGNVQALINSTFGKYAGAASRIARCESGFDPNAHNSIAVYYNGRYLGHAMGVFQIVDATWASTSYAKYSPYNAWANIHAAYEIFQRDGYTWREWQCQP